MKSIPEEKQLNAYVPKRSDNVLKKLRTLTAASALFMTSNILMAGGDIAPVEPVVPEVVASDSWEYSAAINLWAASIGGETAAGGDIDIGFNDILDNLDFTFMGTLGAQKGKWGLLADVLYLNMSQDVYVPLYGGAETITNVGLKSWILTPMVTYRVMEEDQLNLDVLAGARYLYLKSTLDIFPAGPTSGSGNVWDGIVGLRGTYDFNEKWYMPFHFDVGSGETDLTWQAFAGVGYKYENFDLIVGYRYMDFNFDDSDKGGGIFNELTLDGPIVSLKFNF